MWKDPAFQTLARRYYQQAQDPETRIEHFDDVFRERDDVEYGVFPEDWCFVPGN